MVNVPRKHHYVPQVLLSGFTLEGTNWGTLHIVDLIRRSTYSNTPEGTAKERDYNLIEIEGIDPFLIETDLLANQIEGPAGVALDVIRRDGIPNEEQRARLLAFMAMQALRSPNRRESYDDFTTRVARMIIAVATENDEIYEAQKKQHPELNELTREEARALGEEVITRNSPTGHLGVQLPSFGPILELLVARSWTVFAAPDGAEFVCCDDPVVILPGGNRPPWEPRGFADRDSPVVMPVGRRHALFGTWPEEGSEPVWHGMSADLPMVAVLNASQAVIGARRFVASASENWVWLHNETIANRPTYVEIVKRRPQDPGDGR